MDGGHNQKQTKVCHKGMGGYTACIVDGELQYFVKPRHKEYPRACNVRGAFDAAFARLLWPLV